MKRRLMNYVAFFVLAFVLMAQTSSLVVLLSASENSGVSITDILEDNNNTGDQQQTQQPAGNGSSINNNSNNVIDSITTGLDHSKIESDVVKKGSAKLNYYAGIIIQLLAYFITAAMTISKLLDILYLGVPPLRKFLANGYLGNGGAAGTPGSQMGGLNAGMGGGMMGGGMGMGGMGMGRYGRGGMMGGGMMGGMGGMDSGMAMQNQPAGGRIQFVSNAALNAVATESVLGTDGKGQTAFKTYWPDVVVSSIATAILIVLCITGVMSKFGFAIGNFIGDIIGNINL